MFAEHTYHAVNELVDSTYRKKFPRRNSYMAPTRGIAHLYSHGSNNKGLKHGRFILNSHPHLQQSLRLMEGWGVHLLQLHASRTGDTSILRWEETECWTGHPYSRVETSSSKQPLRSDMKTPKWVFHLKTKWSLQLWHRWMELRSSQQTRNIYSSILLQLTSTLFRSLPCTWDPAEATVIPMFLRTVLQELQIIKALTIQIIPKYHVIFSPHNSSPSTHTGSSWGSQAELPQTFQIH